MKNLLLIGTLVLSMNAFAKSDKGNGGDICENKMRNITNDIESWLLNDEYRGIKLPVNLTEELYKQEMLGAVRKSILSCTTDRILVGSAEKTCRNFVDNNGEPQIQCNFNRFNSTDEKERYKLMHHELAGVSSFETNVNEASNYQISNQVGEFLSQATVLVLGIKKITPINDKIGACKLLPPNTSDKNRKYCGGTSFGVTYNGYFTESKCFSSAKEASDYMTSLYSCNKTDTLGDFKVLPPNTSDKNRKFCDGISFGVTYNGYFAEEQACHSSIDGAIKRMEELAR